jgi:hypothetical protein
LTQIAFLLSPEYDPDLSFDSGSIEKADEQTRRRATEMMVPGAEEAQATA